jgi:hypothetical protein
MYGIEDVAVGVWWRFSEYIVDKGIIRPTPGAKLLKCDPWESFRGAHAGKHDVSEGKRQMDPPYKSLVNLTEGRSVSAPHESEILEWCAQYGLLGLLPHRALSATMPARWAPLADDPMSRGWARVSGIKDGDLLPTVETFYRSNVGWNADTTQFLPAERPVSPSRGSEVLDRLLPRGCPRPGVVLQALGDSRIVQEALTDSWATYFPEMPKWSSYPPLLSDEFWSVYGEPIHEFWRAAVMLSRSVRILSKARDRDVRDMSVADQSEFGRAYREFNALLTAVSPAVLAPAPCKLKQSWTSRSLVGSLAMMVLLDLTAGYIFRCQNEICEKTFVTTAYQAAYCSPRCRNTAGHRDMRHKKKALELRRRRIPIKKIADQVGVSIETIKRWFS